VPLAPQSTKESDTPAPKRLRLVPNSPEVPARPSEKSPELPSQSSDVAEEYVDHLYMKSFINRQLREDLDVEHGVDVVQEQDDDDVQDVLLCKLYSKLPKYP
jgi:hypothetical protein